MVQRPAWLTRSAMTMVAAMIFVACAGPAAPTATPGPTNAPPTNPPSTGPTAPPSGQPAGEVYPASGEVTCSVPGTPGSFDGEEYVGKVKQISAPDPNTVVFTLCSPDVAFLQKVAFSVFSIYDADWLAENIPNGGMLNDMNGTGPYELADWRKGSEIDYTAFANYWGTPASVPNAVLRWAAESAQRLTELQSGNVHGITNVGPADFETVQNDASLQLATPPEGQSLNTLYLGMNHDIAPWNNLNVRKALAIGIDKQRLVDNFFPPGSEIAEFFTPCALEFACVGDPWPAFDPETAKAMILAEFPDGIQTKIQYRNVIRGYQPLAPQIAQDLQAQLADIGITATIDEQESATFIDNSNQGLLDGLFMLGWGADYPEITNFMDYHFGPGCTSAFGACMPEIADQLAIGNSTAVEAEREAAYTAANNAIRDLVPMVPIAHGAFANAYVAGLDVAQASPLSNELLFRMAPPSGDAVVFMQNAEPGTLFCADETDGEALRACEQSMESLYAFRINGSEVEPALAESCTPNDDATVWTCALRQGVTFHNGATFDAHDVITSFALQWDAANPLHKGKTSQFEYWTGLWGDFLHRSAQPAPPES